MFLPTQGIGGQNLATAGLGAPLRIELPGGIIIEAPRDVQPEVLVAALWALFELEVL